MSASIVDVAKVAGVSKTTVSAVLSGHSNVRPATRNRVLDAIEQLDYHPNLAARELITATKMNIGVVLPTYQEVGKKQKELYFPYINEAANYDIVSKLIELISKTKYGLLTEHVTISENEPQLPAFVVSNRVAGVFQISPLFDSQFVKKLKKHAPCVVDIGIMNPECDSVFASLVQITKTSVDYFVQHGHRRIAFINGDPVSRAYSDRQAGYWEGLTAHHIDADASIIRAVPFTGIAGYRAFADIWEHAVQKPTALICSTGVVAGGAMRYIYEKGIRVPEDISIISNGDDILCEFATPTITCICRDKREIAQIACKLMMDRLKEPDMPIQAVQVPHIIIERQSVRTI